MGPGSGSSVPGGQPGAHHAAGQVCWARQSLVLTHTGRLGTSSAAAPSQPRRVPDDKDRPPWGRGGTQRPRWPTPWAPPGRREQDSPCPPLPRPSRSPLHLSRHRRPSTLPPGSPSLGQAPQRRACPGAPGPPRSRGQPGVSRAAWTGPDRNSRAQVGASFLLSLSTGADQAAAGSEGARTESSGADSHPTAATFQGKARRLCLPDLFDFLPLLLNAVSWLIHKWPWLGCCCFFISTFHCVHLFI